MSPSGATGFFFDASGFVDPLIVINPSFADADKDRVVFGDGVAAPNPSIPEPASTALPAA